MHKKYFTTLLAATAFVALAGCSTPTVITLKDGTELETKNEPKYDEGSGFYEFEQRGGKPTRINKDDIHSIIIK